MNWVDSPSKLTLMNLMRHQQVAQICKMARPKIQKWIGDAGEDNAELMGACHERRLEHRPRHANVLTRRSALQIACS